MNKTLSVRLPKELVADIESESRLRKISKSDVVRERLQSKKSQSATLAVIGDLIGSVKGLPPDLSAKKKAYLRAGYGKKRTR